ncbi:DNA-directed RNA polymerase subunit H [Candidatus Woesearchaeota archaeon CG10_big_fil_rev_8_21_14_0_10_32_24]|nr:MAG: DNA-directed RNA polymerase subunit H [Candidatus Woesearchaeota archaeon CG10_big_fil_rev_8_21_14_0_10_32_24]
MTLNILQHQFVPKHSKVSDSEKEKLFAIHNIEAKHLPKILVTDPAIVKLDAKQGDVIKIERRSRTAGTSDYYRLVVEE